MKKRIYCNFFFLKSILRQQLFVYLFEKFENLPLKNIEVGPPYTMFCSRKESSSALYFCVNFFSIFLFFLSAFLMINLFLQCETSLLKTVFFLLR